MNYEEAIQYIRQYKSTGISLGLGRMQELCDRLGNPEKKLRFIHIAGSNGKGSTAAYISSILGARGFLVGRYVSPVVFQYEECIQFEDSRGVSYIEPERLAETVSEVAEAVASMEQEGREGPTIFELETAMAFLAFVKKSCQIVVLEVGLGGREDATNVIDNVVASVITPISMDHMGILGDSLPAIAREKAGIIREGVPVISFQKEVEASQVILQTCEEMKTTCVMLDGNEMKLLSWDLDAIAFSYREEHYQTQMLGTYQLENACLAIETCRHLGEDISVDTAQIMLGIRKAKWRGRFEVVSREPLIIVDGAHNESGAQALRESIDTFLQGKLVHGVMGCFRDKEYEKIVSIMQPCLEDIVTVKAPTERGLESEKLANVWNDVGMQKVYVAQSVQEGLKKAWSMYDRGDVIVLFGSLSLLSTLPWKGIKDYSF